MNNLRLSELEPVRVIGYVATALVFAAAVAKQVIDAYDEGTGWIGLGMAVVMAIATEAQRARVTPVAKLEAAKRVFPDDTRFANEGE